ncbi:MAG: hypothetical protein HYW62_00505 [Candidatus Levybacteria bacterium]|nr:hypothetical protein [Candidatus Levybacteria bacterium]
MPSPESLFTLANNNRDAVMGINHTKPDRFGESYWRELLQWQIDSDGERTLILIDGRPDGRRGEIKTFENLRRQVQGLSEEERDNFLSGIIEQIKQAKQVLLIEADEEKYIPIFEQEPHLKAQVTIKKPTVLDLVRLLEIQKINPEISITCITERRRNRATLHEIIGHGKTTDQVLKQLGNLDPFTQLLGTITVHESPKEQASVFRDFIEGEMKAEF